MKEEKDLVVETRALIISSQGGLTLPDLTSDYKAINGSCLQTVCANLGYNSIKEFLQKNSSEFQFGNNGKITASLKRSSKHMQALVDNQKAKKRKRLRAPAKKPYQGNERKRFNNAPPQPNFDWYNDYDFSGFNNNNCPYNLQNGNYYASLERDYHNLQTNFNRLLNDYQRLNFNFNNLLFQHNMLKFSRMC